MTRERVLELEADLTKEKARAESFQALYEELRHLLGSMRYAAIGSPETSLRGFAEALDAMIRRAEALIARAAEPEQSARERLGRFLATHEGSYFEEPETSDSGRPFRVALASVYMSDEHEDAFDPVDVNGVTRGEAINAALDRAEGKEPT